jgi:hypothetical protein
MRTLKESLLSDIDTTLSMTDDDVKTLVNGTIPTIKDFYRNISDMSPWTGVEWECPLLIKKFAKDVERVMQIHNDGYNAENIIGMRCMYRQALSRGHLIFGLFLYDKNKRMFNIRGIGSTTERIGIMDAKKLILKFIKCVCNDHDILNKMADIHNNDTGRWYEDAPYFKDFVKNL